MSKSVKTPSDIRHKIKVNTLKAQLPDGWLLELRIRLGKDGKLRSRTFVSNLINSYEERRREEWAEVIKLRDEYQTRLLQLETQSA